MTDDPILSFANGEDITIIDQQGKVMVSQLGGNVDESKTGTKAVEVATRLLEAVGNVVGESNLGAPETILIQGTNGKFCVLPSNDTQFFVTLLGNIL